ELISIAIDPRTPSPSLRKRLLPPPADQQPHYPMPNRPGFPYPFIAIRSNQFVHELDASLKDLAVKCMFNDINTVVEESIMEDPSKPLILLYDTTFQLGDFYASALIMRHRCLIDENVILVALLLHE
uniref:Uncharacterized protein n=1 Tax=Romanomermis culicivorax TaxID=13658 RepID=A0A915L1D6_ROMCU